MAAELALAGQVAVVAGTGRALDLAIAHRLVEAGATVVLATTEPGLAQPEAATLRSAGFEIGVMPLDPRRDETVAALVEQVTRRHGAPDLWVNVPHAEATGPAEHLPSALWVETLDRLIDDVFRCSRAAAAPMLARGRGVIVNVASVAGLVSAPGHAATSVGLAGLIALTRALGVEWADRGVRVVGVAGPPAYPAGERPLRRPPVGFPAGDADLAEAIVFLAAGTGSYITAETLPVDGGWRAYHLF